MEIVKTCRVCGKTKPIEEFEKTSSCIGGYRCTCKVCRHAAEVKRQERIMSDPILHEKQKAYSRAKYRRRKALGTYRNTKTKNGMNVAIQLRRRGYDMTGKEAHHWNYNFPKSVFILDKKAHRTLHKYMKVDYATNLCYTSDGVLLESVQQALEYFKSILAQHLPNAKIEHIDFSGTKTLKQLNKNNKI